MMKKVFPFARISSLFFLLTSLAYTKVDYQKFPGIVFSQNLDFFAAPNILETKPYGQYAVKLDWKEPFQDSNWSVGSSYLGASMELLTSAHSWGNKGVMRYHSSFGMEFGTFYSAFLAPWDRFAHPKSQSEDLLNESWTSENRSIEAGLNYMQEACFYLKYSVYAKKLHTSVEWHYSFIDVNKSGGKLAFHPVYRIGLSPLERLMGLMLVNDYQFSKQTYIELTVHLLATSNGFNPVSIITGDDAYDRKYLADLRITKQYNPRHHFYLGTRFDFSPTKGKRDIMSDQLFLSMGWNYQLQLISY